MYICKFCNTHSSPNKTGLTRHEKHCLSNENRIPNNPGRKGIKIPHTEETKRKIAEKATGRASTIEKEVERKRKISEKAKLNNGGYRIGSGRGKKGWYKGIYCDSSWELAYVIFNIDHDITIRRCEEIRKYEWEGKPKNYYPDFVVGGKIIEIKGYYSSQTKEKLKYNPDIFVIDKDNIKPYLEYVIEKYGKNFIKLYE